MQTTNQEKFRIEKVITRKGSIMQLSAKQGGYDNYFLFIVGLIKKDIAKSYYATKADLENVKNFNFALKSNLPNLKTEVDKLD